MDPTTARPGGRSARIRAGVLAATRDLVTEVGYDALSIEQIATRAGVHKTTIYRRWPDKAQLVMEAVEDRSAERVPLPDTGSLEGDLRQFSRAIVANLTSEGGRTMARTLVIAANAAEEPSAAGDLSVAGDLSAAASGFWARRFSIAGEMISRAIERGEVPAHTNADAVIETLIGPLYVRALLTDGRLDRRLADRAARVAASAAVDGQFLSKR